MWPIEGMGQVYMTAFAPGPRLGEDAVNSSRDIACSSRALCLAEPDRQKKAYSVILRKGIGTAGTPATVDPGATSRVTTAFAPTVALSPIVTPPSTVTPRPIQTSLPIRIGFAMWPDSRMLCSLLR